MVSPVAPVVPIYLLVDVSASMTLGIVTVNEAIRSTMLDIDSPIEDRVHLAVISFSDQAEVVLPLTPIGDISAPPFLHVQGGTRYGPLFRILRETIGTDVEHLKRAGYRVARPVAFFLTDGAPTDGWEQDYKALMDDKYHPTVVAFGIASADPVILARIASLPELAFMAQRQVNQDAAIRSYGEAVRNYFHGLSHSMQAGIPKVESFVDSSFEMVPYAEDWV